MNGENLGDILAAALNDKEKNPRHIPFPNNQLVHVWADLKAFPDRKIHMIKEIRQLFGLGLREAKDVVESTDGFVVHEIFHKALVNSTSAGWWVTFDPYTKTYNPYRIFC